MTSASDPALPGTRGRWLLLGLSSLFAVYLVLLIAQPGGTSEVVRWLYNFLLVGAAFVCLTSPNQRGKERAAWRCIGATLLLWAAGDFYYTNFLMDSTVSPPTVTDVLWLISYPIIYAGIGLLVRARTVHFERSLWLDADGCLDWDFTNSDVHPDEYAEGLRLLRDEFIQLLRERELREAA